MSYGQRRGPMYTTTGGSGFYVSRPGASDNLHQGDVRIPYNNRDDALAIPSASDNKTTKHVTFVPCDADIIYRYDPTTAPADKGRYARPSAVHHQQQQHHADGNGHTSRAKDEGAPLNTPSSSPVMLSRERRAGGAGKYRKPRKQDFYDDRAMGSSDDEGGFEGNMSDEDRWSDEDADGHHESYDAIMERHAHDCAATDSEAEREEEELLDAMDTDYTPPGPAASASSSCSSSEADKPVVEQKVPIKKQPSRAAASVSNRQEKLSAVPVIVKPSPTPSASVVEASDVDPRKVAESFGIIRQQSRPAVAEIVVPAATTNPVPDDDIEMCDDLIACGEEDDEEEEKEDVAPQDILPQEDDDDDDDGHGEIDPHYMQSMEDVEDGGQEPIPPLDPDIPEHVHHTGLVEGIDYRLIHDTVLCADDYPNGWEAYPELLHSEMPDTAQVILVATDDPLYMIKRVIRYVDLGTDVFASDFCADSRWSLDQRRILAGAKVNAMIKATHHGSSTNRQRAHEALGKAAVIGMPVPETYGAANKLLAVKGQPSARLGSGLHSATCYDCLHMRSHGRRTRFYRSPYAGRGQTKGPTVFTMMLHQYVAAWMVPLTGFSGMPLAPNITKTGFSYSLDDIASTQKTALTALFDDFILLKVRVRAFPQTNVHNNSLEASSITGFMCYTCIDLSDKDAPSSIADMADNPTFRMHMIGVPFQRSFTPMVSAKIIGTSDGVGMADKNTSIWVDTKNSNAFWYGLKAIIDPGKNNAANQLPPTQGWNTEWFAFRYVAHHS